MEGRAPWGPGFRLWGLVSSGAGTKSLCTGARVFSLLKERITMDAFVAILFIVGYILLQYWVLPRLGVTT